MFEMSPYRGSQLWNPFADMEKMLRSDFFTGSSLAEFRTDITDEGDHFLLKADLPGFRKEDIHLELEDGGTLRIHAERHSEHEEKDKQGKYVCCERSYGTYSRRFDMNGIDVDNISAAYENGVLALTLPKLVEKPVTSRKIDIQ